MFEIASTLLIALLACLIGEYIYSKVEEFNQ